MKKVGKNNFSTFPRAKLFDNLSKNEHNFSTCLYVEKIILQNNSKVIGKTQIVW
jgi:hypothetical protein